MSPFLEAQAALRTLNAALDAVTVQELGDSDAAKVLCLLVRQPSTVTHYEMAERLGHHPGSFGAAWCRALGRFTGRSLTAWRVALVLLRARAVHEAVPALSNEHLALELGLSGVQSANRLITRETGLPFRQWRESPSDEHPADAWRRRIRECRAPLLAFQLPQPARRPDRRLALQRKLTLAEARVEQLRAALERVA